MEAEWMARYAELTDLSMRLEQIQQQLPCNLSQYTTSTRCGIDGGGIDGATAHVRATTKTLEKYTSDVFRILDSYASTGTSLPSDEQARAQLERMKTELDPGCFGSDITALGEQSNEGIRRIRGILDELRDFSQMDGSSEWHWVDLRASLATALDLMRDEINDKAVVFKAYGDMPKIECLPMQLNRALMSLIVNASRAIGSGKRGRIAIDTGCEGDRVWVAISDNGCGISPEDQTLVFTPFFTTNAAGISMGLGLSMSHDIVSKHGGEIRVSSKIGGGTTFRVPLPQRRTPTPCEQGCGASTVFWSR